MDHRLQRLAIALDVSTHVDWSMDRTPFPAPLRQLPRPSAVPRIEAARARWGVLLEEMLRHAHTVLRLDPWKP
jgi:hypothetical protein